MTKERGNRRYYDEEGTYITGTQLKFYLNRGLMARKSFFAKDEDFIGYYEECRAYNFISDFMERDEMCASLVWDEDVEEIVFHLPRNGKVVKAMAKFNMP